MATYLVLGIGAGLVSALLFSVVAAGSPTGVLLLYLAPLPIFIVALGWHHLLGLLALAVGGLAISVGLRPSAAMAYALGPALPAWWLSYLALLARPAPMVAANDGAPVAWYPAGSLLMWIGVSGAVVSVVSAVAIGGFDHATYQDRLGRIVNAFLRLQTGAGRSGPIPPVAGIQAETLVRALVILAPAGLASLIALIVAANLWAAAKVVAISGRLARPWPFLPATRMPLLGLGGLATGLILFQLPGYAGTIGAALIGSFSLAFALQGLAFLHDVSRGKPGRLPLLILTYLFALILGQVVLPVLAVLGMADTATSLRSRLAARGEKKPPPLPPT